MAVEERIFYTSENGDERLLIDEGDTVAVRHRPNTASGGEARTTDLVEFLMSERHSAQNRALHKLIATLTHAPPAESSEEVFASARLRSRTRNRAWFNFCLEFRLRNQIGNRFGPQGHN